MPSIRRYKVVVCQMNTTVILLGEAAIFILRWSVQFPSRAKRLTKLAILHRDMIPSYSDRLIGEPLL